LNDECNKPDIVCISEHHLSVNELFTFSMLEYKMPTICMLFISEVSCLCFCKCTCRPNLQELCYFIS
jgi:hypothetical protein